MQLQLHIYTMQKAQIEHLLKNWNYDQALRIYLPHCSSPTLKKLLAETRNTFTTKKLREGLRSLMEAPEPVVAAEPTEPPQVQQRTELAQAYHSAPTEVQVKISERIHLVAEARLLHQKLHQMGDLERRDAVLKIAGNWKKAQQCYEYEEYYQQHKELPPKPEQKDEIVMPESDVDALKMYKTLMTYKRRNSWPKYEATFEALKKRLKENGII